MGTLKMPQPKTESNDAYISLKKYIEDSIIAIEAREDLALRRVSEEASAEAAVESHRELMLIGLLDYSLSKLMTKVHYKGLPEKFYDQIINDLKRALAGPKKQTLLALEDAENRVVDLDRKEGNFEDTLIDKAKIKKAASLYSKGFSVRRASEMTGAEPSEVSSYVGTTKIHELKGSRSNAKRFESARRIFNIKDD